MLREWGKQGWTAEMTGKEHYKLRHANVVGHIVIGSTPSDHRSMQNMRSDIKRAIRTGLANPKMIARQQTAAGH